MKVDIVVEKRKPMSVEEIYDYLTGQENFQVKKEVFHRSYDLTDKWLGFLSDGSIQGFKTNNDLVDYLRALKITRGDFIVLEKISLILKIE